MLVAPGRYHERVVISTPHLHLRGLNRNTVIVDGLHQVGYGIVVAKADDVWIENLTVRNWDRKSRDDEASGGNEIWFNGGDDSGAIGASGWHGNWLTVYDTGRLGGYGIFTSNSVNGEFDHVYASGFNDSGLYIGACPDCHATVSHALMERNALGFSGTNAGGHLIVQDSVLRLNAVGGNGTSLQLPWGVGSSRSAPTATVHEQRDLGEQELRDPWLREPGAVSADRGQDLLPARRQRVHEQHGERRRLR